MRHLFTTLCLLSFLLLTALPMRMGAKEVTIELPPEIVRYREAPGSALAAAFCLTCHSADYTEMQPPMPRTFWEAEVKKMREKYLAPIPPAIDSQLVDYLTRAYGPPAAASGAKQ